MDAFLEFRVFPTRVAGVFFAVASPPPPSQGRLGGSPVTTTPLPLGLSGEGEGGKSQFRQIFLVWSKADFWRKHSLYFPFCLLVDLPGPPSDPRWVLAGIPPPSGGGKRPVFGTR